MNIYISLSLVYHSITRVYNLFLSFVSKHTMVVSMIHRHLSATILSPLSTLSIHYLPVLPMFHLHHSSTPSTSPAPPPLPSSPQPPHSRPTSPPLPPNITFPSYLPGTIEHGHGTPPSRDVRRARVWQELMDQEMEQDHSEHSWRSGW